MTWSVFFLFFFSCCCGLGLMPKVKSALHHNPQVQSHVVPKRLQLPRPAVCQQKHSFLRHIMKTGPIQSVTYKSSDSISRLRRSFFFFNHFWSAWFFVDVCWHHRSCDSLTTVRQSHQDPWESWTVAYPYEGGNNPLLCHGLCNGNMTIMLSTCGSDILFY